MTLEMEDSFTAAHLCYRRRLTFVTHSHLLTLAHAAVLAGVTVTLDNGASAPILARILQALGQSATEKALTEKERNLK